MTNQLANFAARLRRFITSSSPEAWIMREPATARQQPGRPSLANRHERTFEPFALELFALQFTANAPYRKFCEARSATPQTVTCWKEIPAAPTAAFKDFEMTCLPPAQRTRVFHSSGTTGHRPSRHFHNAESLAVYEASLLLGFQLHIMTQLPSLISNLELTILAPPPEQAPHSSLVHMFESVRRAVGANTSAYLGHVAGDGAWIVVLERALAAFELIQKERRPLVLLGTAFSFLHLLDFLAENNLRFSLPPGSRVMETGGYKGRSRSLPKEELHALITQRLGIPASHIVCEYGMSELSSQAYDRAIDTTRNARHATRDFRFPPWARVQIISPGTGLEVREGETGLIRVFDLANVFSVLAIQTEDLGVRRADGFELVGRAEHAERRGCSLMAA